MTVVTKPQTQDATNIQEILPGTCAPQRFTNASTLSWTDMRTGQPYPFWQQRISQHKSAVTPCSGILADVSVTESTAKGIYIPVAANPPCYPKGSIKQLQISGKWVRITSGDIVYPLNSSDPSGRTYSQASGKFYQAVRESYRPFDGPTFLGELRETIHMIRHPLDAIFRQQRMYLKRCRNPRIQQLVRNRRYDSASKILSDLWLEGYLGWYPLTGDVESALELLNRLTNKEEYQHVVGYAVNSGKLSTSSPATLSSSVQLSCTRVLTREATYSVRFLGEVKLATSTSQSPSSLMGQLAGFEWTNVPISIWELIPSSFLIDYVTNIGDIINATFTSLGNVAWCNYTERATVKTEAIGNKLVLNSASPGSYVLGSPGSMAVNATRFTRNDNYPTVPGLVFSIPGLRQTITISALLGSHFATKKYLRS